MLAVVCQNTLNDSVARVCLMRHDKGGRTRSTQIEGYAGRLKAAMELAGMKPDDPEAMKELAKAVGITYTAVYYALEGKTQAFNAANNERAARALGVNPYWLATGDETPEPRRLPKLSNRAIDLAIAFDKIPESHELERDRVYYACKHFATGERAATLQIPPLPPARDDGIASNDH